MRADPLRPFGSMNPSRDAAYLRLIAKLLRGRVIAPTGDVDVEFMATFMESIADRIEKRLWVLGLAIRDLLPDEHIQALNAAIRENLEHGAAERAIDKAVPES